MSCRNAARTATCASRPTSRAMMPARRATSAECEQHVLAVAGAELAGGPSAAGFPDADRAGPSSKATAAPSLRIASSVSSFTFCDDLLDARRMDAAVGDQPLDRLLRDLAAVRIEAGQDDRARRVVDDQIDAGRELERADVAALAADDAALEVVARQIDDRDGGLDGVLGGAALDGLGDVCLRAIDGRLARLGVEALQQVRGVVPRVGFDLPDQQLLRFVGGQARDALELVLLLRDELLVACGRRGGRSSRARRGAARGAPRSLSRSLERLLAARRAPPRARRAVCSSPAICWRSSRACCSASTASSWACSLASRALPCAGFPRRARRRAGSREACSSARPTVSAAMRLRLATQQAKTAAAAAKATRSRGCTSGTWVDTHDVLSDPSTGDRSAVERSDGPKRCDGRRSIRPARASAERAARPIEEKPRFAVWGGR